MRTPSPGSEPATTIVDGNNVIGAIADGWWRDPPAAVRRLLARLVQHRGRTRARLVLVLDVPQRDLPAGHHDGVEVRYAQRRGRNAADDEIVTMLDVVEGPVEIVTSDRDLRRRGEERGATVVGARTFLGRL